MLTKAQTKLIQDGQKTITKLGELVEQLELENEQLRAKLGMGERPQETAAFDVLTVTNVQVWPFKEGVNMGHLRGMAQIVLNDQLVIRALRVMEGVNGLYVAYPIDAFYKGEDFRNICNPITRALREHIENVVLEKYQQAISEG